jgi:hypothetical protein
VSYTPLSISVHDTTIHGIMPNNPQYPMKIYETCISFEYVKTLRRIASANEGCILEHNQLTAEREESRETHSSPPKEVTTQLTQHM